MASSGTLAPGVERLLASAIDTIEKLELLVYLRSAAAPKTIDELATVLAMSAAEVGEGLAGLLDEQVS